MLNDKANSEAIPAESWASDSLPVAKKRPVRKFLIAIFGVLLIGGGGVFAYNQFVANTPKPKGGRKSRTVKVERTNLPVIVSANGTIQPDKSINVSPKTAGKLKSLVAKEGDVVTEGQVLAYMDDSNLQGQLIQAKGQLAAAQANLKKLAAGNRSQDIAQAQANLNSAKANLRQSEFNLGQNQKLFGAGAISSRDFESSRAVRDADQAKVMQFQQALSLQQVGTRPEDIEQARAQVLSAQGVLQSIQTQVNDAVIRAPFTGTVVRKFADPGAFVTPTTSGSAVSSATASSILALASNNQVVANVAEVNISQIAIAQPIAIQADAFTGKSFKGKVVSISPQSIVQQNVTSFEVKAAILSQDKNLLRSGMNVNVDFQAGELKDVLVVPTVAIARQQGGTGVFVRGAEGEPPVFTTITTGVSVNDKTEVKSGLKGDERVFISFPEGMRPRSNVPGGIPGLSPSAPRSRGGS